MRPDYMIDCLECGAQEWKLDKRTEEIVRVICGNCGLPDSFELTDGGSGADCIICTNDTWEIAEWSPTDDWHIILRCTDCEELAEIWLQGDELEQQNK